MYVNKKYCYRIIERKDIEWARNLHNSPDVLYLLTDTSFITEEQQLAWFKSISVSSKSKRLVLEYNNEKIGLARLDDIDFINKSICVGLDLVKEYRGKGHGFNGFNILLEYCFNELNMHRAWLLVAEHNTTAINLYKKLGFIEEGKQRQRLFREGKYLDYIMMSILKEEYYDKNV